MSKPDPTGGSLDNILASIRRSLSEQSTDALGDDQSVAPADATQKDGKPGRKVGLTQRLEGATGDPSQVNGTGTREDDISDLLEDPPPRFLDDLPRGKTAPSPVAAPSPAVAPSSPASQSDPLWFLTRRPEPAATASEQPSVTAAPLPASKVAPTPAAEPKLTRPEVVRATLPPFFGSSTEFAKAEVAAPPEPVASGAGVMQPPKGQPDLASATPAAAPDSASRLRGVDREPAKTAAARTVEPEVAREVSLVAAAVEAAVVSPRNPGTAAASDTRNSPANPFVERAAGAEAGTTTSADETPHTNALEVMVLELLQPMLRQWLDQNMPRLVAAALRDEVVRAGKTDRDANRT